MGLGAKRIRIYSVPASSTWRSPPAMTSQLSRGQSVSEGGGGMRLLSN